jgi:hypothetical protein
MGKKYNILLIISLMCFQIAFSAGHVSSFITYKHIQGNQFKFIFETIRDGGSTPLNYNFKLNISDSSNSIQVPLYRTSITYAKINDTSLFYPLNTFSTSGLEKHNYECVVNFDSIASGAFKSSCRIYCGVEFCCRSNKTTYLTGNAYVECMLDKCLAPNNSGPNTKNLSSFRFQSQQSTYFNPIIADTTDFDILSFHLADFLEAKNSPGTYNSPYYKNMPVMPICYSAGVYNCSPNPKNATARGLYFDTLNGNFIFSPYASQENSSFVYKINEYRKINGVLRLIGYTYYDASVRVFGKTYETPTLTSGTLEFNHYFKTNKSQKIKFDIRCLDTSTADSIIIQYECPIKGATVSVTKAWRPSAEFSWSPNCDDIRNEPYVFTLYFYNEKPGKNHVQAISFNVFVQSDLNIGADTIICKNGSLDLNSNVTGAYKWNGSTVDTFQMFNVSQAGKYWLDVTNNNCLVSDTILITEINELPKIDIGNDTLLCNPAPDFRLLISTIPQKFTQYGWNINPIYNYPYVYFADTGRLILTASNVCGSVSDTLNISKNYTPEIALPKDTLLCDKNSFDLVATEIVKGDLLWNNGSKGLSINVLQTGLYWLESINQCGKDRDSFFIEMMNSPQEFLGKDTDICLKDTLFLKANSLNCNYLWNNGKVVDTMTITREGIYWLQSSNKCGLAKDTIQVAVLKNPKVYLGNDTLMCEPVSRILKVSCYKCQYVWNNQSQDSFLHVSKSGTYIIKAQNQCGVYTDSIEISSLTTPTVELPKDTTIKKPFSLELKSLLPLNKYHWSTGDTTESILVKEWGTYWLKSSNQCGESTDSIQIKENVGLNLTYKNSIKGYPNPSQDVVYIDGLNGAERVELISSTGQVEEVELNNTNEKLEINLKHLNSGIYTLLIHSEKGIYFCKIIKN